MFIAALFTIAKCWKQPKCPSVNEWIKKLWYIYTMEYYTAERKKELLPFTSTQIDLESIMLSEIRQKPYDLTYKWNLINKTNKLAKYNQINWNKEQNDSNQRGAGRGIMGGNREGSSKNMYKGHMDKAKGGRIEGGRWWWMGHASVVGWKWRQLCFNNDEKIINK